jgi:hypothetical protein
VTSHRVTNEELEWIGDLAVQILRQGVLPEGYGAAVPDEVVQQLLTVGVKLYLAKLEAAKLEDRAEPGPFIGHVITGTDVAATSVKMLDALKVNMLDYALWKSLGKP